ncbi:MAG: AI-2E family transporter [Oligoflexia bacterium]|nr:AI-2E family transporter [Oligoflexia bacterium]
MTPDQQRQKIVKRERWIKLTIVAVILISALVVLLAIPGMLVSFLIAFVITYLFKPPVNYLERMGVGRTIAILIPFIVLGGIIATSSSILIPKAADQISALQLELPKYIKGVSDITIRHTKKFNSALSQFSSVNLSEKIELWLQGASGSLLISIPNWVTQLFTTMILAPFFAFFMLRDGREISRQLLGFVPNHLFELSLNLMYQINQQLGGFIRARLLESVIVGVVVWLGLSIMGFPYSAILAVFAGLTNLIPYIGPIIGAVPAIIVAMVNQEGGTSTIALVGLVYLIAQIVDMLVIIPLVIAKIVDLHPVTVVIVIITGGQFMGVLGMIISIPVASIIKLTFTVFYNHVVDFRS